MFQATRQRLALWYTIVTAVLLLLFASGFYLYVRSTLVERIDDTLNHVVEVVQRSLIVEPVESGLPEVDFPRFRVNLEASFADNAEAVEDDHIDLEWFNPAGDLLWSTFSAPLDIPLHPSEGETVYGKLVIHSDQDIIEQLTPLSFALRQVTREVILNQQTLGYLRVSHPWFEVTKPSRQLIRDLSLGTALMIGAVAAIGWLLSGLAIAPVRDSYQRLKQFTADASHELRNPIAIIQTNVQVALADPDPQLQQAQLRVVERLTRRLGRLVDDLLFLARQDSGITPPKRAPVQLEALLAEVIEEQQTIAADKTLTLSLHCPEGSGSANSGDSKSSPYLLQADPDQLGRLFTNLISNAIQYTPQGRVDINLRRVKHQGISYLQVQIQDTGIGIPPDALPQIFERFYRVDPARSNAGLQPGQTGSTTGSGLGLSIASIIVENHQGQIQVESVLHKGTTFTVLLPCSTVN
ncbi:sensor histidine kinase [Egbenema bharatensis]|uniref:sensor histidine kinase n=1 Tax=Egbenema bharatensis TaxID=3463334 RepID=UPI003A86F7AB